MTLRTDGKHRKVRVIRTVAALVLGRELDPELETIEHTCYRTLCICPNCFGLMTNVDNASSAMDRRMGRELTKPMTMLVTEGRYWHPDEPIPF